MKTKLYAAFAALFLLVLSIGALAAWFTAKTQADTRSLYQNTLGSAELGKANSALWQLRYGFPQFMLADEAGKKKIVDEEAKWVKVIDEALNAYSQTGLNAEEQAALAELRAVYKQYIEARPKWFALQLEGKVEEAKAWRAQTTTPYGAATVKGFGALIDLQAKVAAEEQAQEDAGSRQVRWVVIAISLVALGGVVLLSLWVTRLLTGPVAHATEVASRIAQGDLASPVHGAGRGPLGDLLSALEQMQRSLETVVGGVRQQADGVATASVQIAQGNGHLSSRTEQQASALQQTASSMQELGQTVRKNADSAGQANELAQTASRVASHGGEVVSQVVEMMKTINESSQKIADIISVIDGIAFQTNILALNAAVEAARAGEQGRGFAVVASEVRSLAGRSADAAKEIKTLIEASVARVEQGTSLADRAGSTMGEVVQSIARLTQIVSEISLASGHQSTGVAQVGQAIEQMDQTTQQNAALVEESAAAAASLQEQAHKLVQSVAVFRLSHGAQPQPA